VIQIVKVFPHFCLGLAIVKGLDNVGKPFINVHRPLRGNPGFNLVFKGPQVVIFPYPVHVVLCGFSIPSHKPVKRFAQNKAHFMFRLLPGAGFGENMRDCQKAQDAQKGRQYNFGCSFTHFQLLAVYVPLPGGSEKYYVSLE
jgi:hypothetical protein